MAVIWILSSRTLDTVKPLPFPHADKLVHMVVFGALSFLWIHALRRQRLIRAFGVTVVYGLIDEWHQFYVPGRDCDPLDVVANALGALLVCLAVRHFQNIKRNSA